MQYKNPDCSLIPVNKTTTAPVGSYMSFHLQVLIWVPKKQLLLLWIQKKKKKLLLVSIPVNKTATAPVCSQQKKEEEEEDTHLKVFSSLRVSGRVTRFLKKKN